MTELPAPLTPPDCDLRGYDFMPLHGHRLFTSDFYYNVSADAFRAGLRLWWAAWQQCPAASLPDDDTALCRLADMGRDMKGWKAIRADALRGFVKCADGRLYHPTLAELAIDAWDRRRRDRERKANMRAARSKDNTGTGGGNGGSGPTACPTDNAECPTDNSADNAPASADKCPDKALTGQDRTGEERDTSLRSVSAPRDLSRGHRLPDEWLPDPDGTRLCADLGLCLATTLAKFRDHWRAQPGAKGRKLDWDATWRNWCRSEPAMARGRAAPPRDDASARRVAAFRAAAEEAGVTIDQQGFILQ